MAAQEPSFEPFGDMKLRSFHLKSLEVQSITVEDHFIVKKVVFYRVVVKLADPLGDSFKVRKRYRDFRALHQDLENIIPGDRLPKLPGKKLKMLVDHQKNDFIWERQFKLNNYVQDVLEYSLSNFSVSERLGEFLLVDRLSESDDTKTEDELKEERAKPANSSSAGICGVFSEDESLPVPAAASGAASGEASGAASDSPPAAPEREYSVSVSDMKTSRSTNQSSH